MIDMIKPEIIAFYLPQFHPFPEMITGGGKDLRNGQMLERLGSYFPGIISLEFRQI